MLEFHATGLPKPQPRPRAAFFGGKARMYEPASVKPWKKAMRTQMAKFAPNTPEMGPVGVDLKFLFQRPKSHLRASGALAKQAPRFATGHNLGDIDNLIKAVLDVMTELGFWIDDSLVISITAKKEYAREGQEQGVSGTVWSTNGA